MASPFTAKTLSFLRALARNNDRDWFRARKTDYERHVRQPMLALVERLSRDLPAFAPELVADPRISLYRIYRDTRFSEDKRPLKTHIAAHFPARAFGRSGGAGLYVEIAPQWVWIGGGLYMPEASELRTIRAHIADTHPRLHELVTTRTFTARVGRLDGERLTRTPRGYAADHPAAPYLQLKQFLAGREYEAALATSSRFYTELRAVFRAVAPVVRFLNTPLLEGAASTPVTSATGSRPAGALPPPPAPMW